MSAKRIRHLVLRGNAFERGFQHGQELADKIRANIECFQSTGFLPEWSECQTIAKIHFIPAIAKYFPDGLEEIKGIAEGANLPVEDIVILNSACEFIRLYMRRKRRQKQSGFSEETQGNQGLSNSGTSGSLGFNQTNGTFNGSRLETRDWTQLNIAGLAECTGMACLPETTEEGDTFVGQNFDQFDSMIEADTAVLLEIYPSEKTIPPMLTVTQAGELTRNGMNAEGLGIVGMWLYCSEDSPEPTWNSKDIWIPVQLLRRQFLQQPRMAHGLARLLQCPKYASMSVIVACGQETGVGDAIVIETTPAPPGCSSRHYLSYPGETGLVTHANHWIHPAFHGRDDTFEEIAASHSYYRDRRLLKGLKKLAPKIDDFNIQTAFMDHYGHPESLCLHPAEPGKEHEKLLPFNTNACAIYNLTQRTMQVCKGNPCEAEFECFGFAGRVQHKDQNGF